MALKTVRSFWIVALLLFFCSALIPAQTAHALAGDPDAAVLPSLSKFIEQVKNGQATELRGIYIPKVMAARVVQQPDGADDFVSPWQNTITQFGLAAKLGSTGLLAHNYLAGEHFSNLEAGQKFYLIYGDGHISTFVVAETQRYQALEPDSISGAFVDLESGATLAYASLFSQVYNKPGHVIFQTCIYEGDNSTWGRLFVIAEPELP